MEKAVRIQNVMYIVMSFAPRPTVSRMMQTCRALNKEGVKYILHDDVNLHLNVPEEITSFFLFIIADPHPRLRSVRGLSLTPHHFMRRSEKIQDGVPERLKNLFVLLAALGEKFVRLELCEADEILQLHPDLPDAVASLTRLQDLKMIGAGSVSCKMLRNLRSSLCSALITMLDSEDDPSLTPEDKILTVSLQNSQSTLQALQMAQGETIPDGPCYPKVIVLDLAETWTFTTHHFTHAFPNLREFFIRDSFVEALDVDVDQDDLTTVREENLSLQRLHESWKALDLYSGGLGILYALGLTCPIAEVRLDDTDGDGFDGDVLQAVLGDARPVSLTISLSDGFDLAEPEVVSALRERCAAELGKLELHLKFKPQEAAFDLQLELRALLDAICSLIDSSVVTAFELELSLECSSFMKDCKICEPSSIIFNGIDETAYTDLLFAKGKNLKTVHLTLCHKHYGSNRKREVKRVQN
ncbi:hypothetical protein L226DRAFT_610742 [Lentinus tigrinus ALCF2SS1-7]|uniref:uncharacterized protein n=1 Tax=Lentinus tigrinus ALCF2SS1-7 TaxID=1328758 RepID=UPI001166267F|nr:hypothetical protein L226DRAFT_610742 [Lentinus tigrinus ALCF2SS1-7]